MDKDISLSTTEIPTIPQSFISPSTMVYGTTMSSDSQIRPLAACLKTLLSNQPQQ
jgi:hypothetical protein